MAKEKLSSSTQSQDSEFDFSFDNATGDSGKDFNFDFGADTDTESNRSPISHVRKGAGALLSSTATTFIPGMRDRIMEKIPDAAKFSGEVGQFTSDLKYLSTEFQKDLAPTIAQMKRAGRALAPRVKQFLPKRLADKYDQWTSDAESKDRTTQKISKDQTEELAITASIDSIFNKATASQLKAQHEQYEDQKSDTLMDRTLTAKRHQASFEQMRLIQVSASFQQKFTEDIYIPYLKKDLELKHRHLYIARDTLTAMKGMAKIFSDQLDQIRHNTGLPETQKMKLAENIWEQNRQRFGKMGSEWMQDSIKKIRDRILKPITENASMFGDFAEMGSSMIEMEDELNGPKGVGATAGGLAGNLIGGKLAKKTSNLIFGEKYGSKGLLGNKLKKFNHKFKDLSWDLGMKMREAAEQKEGSLIGELLSVLAPDFQRKAGTATNVMTKKPNDPASLTNQAVLSLTTIMPGYLASINKWVETMATGKVAEEKVFDADSNDFINVSTLRQKFHAEAFGSTANRTSKMSGFVGQIRGMYKVESGSKEMESFDKLEPDMLKWLSNMTIYSRRIEPKIIAEYAGLIQRSTDEGDLKFDMFSDVEASEYQITYIKQAFAGVDHPEELCLLLAMILYNGDGTVNSLSVDRFKSIQKELMDKEQYLNTFDKYIRGGNARHLKQYIKSSGAQFTLDDITVRDSMIQGIDVKSEKYTTSRDVHSEQSEAFQRDMQAQVTWDEMLNDPTWNEGILGTIISKAREYTKSESSSDASGTSTKFTSERFKELIPAPLMAVARKIAPQAYEVLDKAQKTFKTGATQITAQMVKERKKDEAAQKQYLEQELLDPYVQARMQEHGQSLGSTSGNIGLAAFMSSVKNMPVMVPMGHKQQKEHPGGLPVKILNIQDLVKGFTGVLKSSVLSVKIDTDPTKKDKPNSVIGAITQFENTFKAYAAMQASIPELMQKLLDVSSVMSGQLDKIMGNTTSSIRAAFRWVGDKTSSVWRGAKGGASWVAKKVLHPLDWTTSIAKYAKDKAVSGVKGGYNLVKPGLMGLLGSAGSALKWTKDAAIASALGIGGGLLSAGGAIKDGLSGGMDAISGRMGAGYMKTKQRLKDAYKTQVSDRIAGVRKKVTAFSNKVKYVDIYLKDQIIPGKPLLAATKQEEGVYFAESGDKVSTSYAINKPVVDNSNPPKTLITEENIKHGLVDANNNPLGGAKSLIGRIIQGGVGLIKGGLKKTKDLLTGGNPIMNLYTKMFGLGLDGAKALGRGGIFAIKRIFGVAESITKDDLHDVVGTRLDIIIAILKKKFNIKDGSPILDGKTSTDGKTSDIAPGDRDGDGNRDTIFEDRGNAAADKAEAKETKKRHGFYDTMAKMKEGFFGSDKKEGFLSKLGGLLKSPFMLMGLIGGAIAKIVKPIFAIASGVGRLITGVGTMIKWLGKIPSGLMKVIMAIKGLGGGAMDLLSGDKKGKGKGKSKGKSGAKGKGKSRFKIPTDKKKLALTAGAVGLGAVGLDHLLYQDEPEVVRDPNEDPSIAGQTEDGEDGATTDSRDPAGVATFDESAKKSGVLGRTLEAGAQGIGGGAVFAAGANLLNGDISGAALATSEALVRGAMMSSPIGLSILAVEAVDHVVFEGRGKQNILNYIGTGTDDFVEARCKIYGVDTSLGFSFGNTWTRVKNMGRSDLQLILKLEDHTFDIIQKKQPAFSDADAEWYADSFGFDDSDVDQIKYWYTWYRLRFIPLFTAYLNALNKQNIKYEDSNSLSNSQKNEILRQIQKECPTEVANVALVPTMKGYDLYKKAYDEKKKDRSSKTLEEADRVKRDEAVASVGRPKQNPNSKYDTDATALTLLNGKKDIAIKPGDLPKSIDPDGKLDPSTRELLDSMLKNEDMARMMRGGRLSDRTPNASGSISALPRGNNGVSGAPTDSNASSSAGTQPGGVPGASGGVAAATGPPPDMSGVNPAQLQGTSGELGSYVAKFESGNKGSAAVAWDPPGGTSYGSYQLSSKMGSLREFVQWCASEAPEVHKALSPMLGQADTGSKSGAFPNAWLQLVKDGKINHALEYKYFQGKFYGSALNKMTSSNPKLAEFVKGNRALQECLWSVSVQHGPAGAVRLFNDHWKEGISVEEFLKSLYANRYTAKYFPRLSKSDPKMLTSMSSNRGRQELSVMLALTKQNPSSGTGGAVATDGSSDGGPSTASLTSGALASTNGVAGAPTAGGGTTTDSGGVKMEAGAGGAMIPHQTAGGSSGGGGAIASAGGGIEAKPGEQGAGDPGATTGTSGTASAGAVGSGGDITAAIKPFLGWKYSQAQREQEGYSDCSSLIGRVGKAGALGIPANAVMDGNVSKTAADQIAGAIKVAGGEKQIPAGTPINPDELKGTYLIGKGGASNNRFGGINHIGIIHPVGGQPHVAEATVSQGVIDKPWGSVSKSTFPDNSPRWLVPLSGAGYSGDASGGGATVTAPQGISSASSGATGTASTNAEHGGVSASSGSGVDTASSSVGDSGAGAGTSGTASAATTASADYTGQIGTIVSLLQQMVKVQEQLPQAIGNLISSLQKSSSGGGQQATTPNAQPFTGSITGPKSVRA